MAQKVLVGRATEGSASDLTLVKVDQVVLARAPGRALSEALACGLKKAGVEVAVAYDGHCVDAHDGKVLAPPDALPHGFHVARPGAGFAAPVHLERFASPARLCVTDEPRLAGVGGAAMLTLVVAPGALAQALTQGTVWLRAPRSIQILIAGKVRPFVCARDVALELVRRGLADMVRRVEERHGGPVVLEFAGPGARLLSVAERAVLCGVAPFIGAAAALFVSDERTEVFLRDQRRSKAHRALVPDPGAPCDDVLNVDLGAVDPLLLDPTGRVRGVREDAGTPVGQVLLGGDSGTTLRDLLAVAALLKSKRVPSKVDFLLAPPSRQVLEVLTTSGALADLLATGARVVEPDGRTMTGGLYAPPPGSLALRTCEPEPRVPGAPAFATASAETLAFAVATGAVGDPRGFKRPARVTVPRVLPTDDVLVVRERRESGGPRRDRPTAPSSDVPWRGGVLEVVEAQEALGPPGLAGPSRGIAILCRSLDEVRQVTLRAATQPAPATGPMLRAVVAPHIPGEMVSLLAALGVASLAGDVQGLKIAKGEGLPLPASAPEATEGGVSLGKTPLRWLHRGREQTWLAAGSARPTPRATAR